MGSRLNWESASRSERVARQGTEPFYRDLSARDSTSEVARDAFEATMRRAARRPRKDDKKLTPVQAKRVRRAKEKKHVQNQRDQLEQYLAECTGDSWASANDGHKEHVILRIDSLLEKIGRGNLGALTLSAARNAIVSYMDEMADTKVYLKHCASEGWSESDLNDLQIDAPEDALEYVARHVVQKQADHLLTLYGNINLSLKRHCNVTIQRKLTVANLLISRRVLAVTPSHRVLYYFRYCKS